MSQKLQGYANPSLRNEEAPELIDKVGQTWYNRLVSKQPLSKFKKGTMEYGQSLEEIYVGLVPKQAFLPNTEGKQVEDMFKNHFTNIQAYYHRSELHRTYRTSTNLTLLSKAVYDKTGVRRIMDESVSAAAKSAEFDEFDIMKGELDSAIAEGSLVSFPIGDITSPDKSVRADAAENFAYTVKGLLPELNYLHRYNKRGVLNSANDKNKTLILDKNASAAFSVNFLSKLFSPAYANYTVETLVLPKPFKDPNVIGMLIDDDFLIALDEGTALRAQPNYLSETMNYALNVHQLFGTSPFSTAVVFTKTAAKGNERFLWNNVGIVAEHDKETVQFDLDGLDATKTYTVDVKEVRSLDGSVVDSVVKGAIDGTVPAGVTQATLDLVVSGFADSVIGPGNEFSVIVELKEGSGDAAQVVATSSILAQKSRYDFFS